jgi:hypothetical protein
VAGAASLATRFALVASPPLITETGTRIIMAVNAYRDKDGEIDRKHGGTLIGTLRSGYGSRFARGCADDEKLSDPLAKLDDEPFLFKLIATIKLGCLL